MKNIRLEKFKEFLMTSMANKGFFQEPYNYFEATKDNYV